MTEVTITPADDGPYQVTGPVELTAPDGTTFAASSETIFLCRCGASEDKPFCDRATADTPPRCTRFATR